MGALLTVTVVAGIYLAVLVALLAFMRGACGGAVEDELAYELDGRAR